MSFAEHLPTPHPQELLGMQTAFFPPQQFAFRIFPPSLGPAESMALIIFHGSAPQQSAVLVGKGRPLALR